MTHEQRLDLAKDAVEDVYEDDSVADERRVISLTELKDSINSYLRFLTAAEFEEDDDNE